MQVPGVAVVRAYTGTQLGLVDELVGRGDVFEGELRAEQRPVDVGGIPGGQTFVRPARKVATKGHRRLQRRHGRMFAVGGIRCRQLIGGGIEAHRHRRTVLAAGTVAVEIADFGKRHGFPRETHGGTARGHQSRHSGFRDASGQRRSPRHPHPAVVSLRGEAVADGRQPCPVRQCLRQAALPSPRRPQLIGLPATRRLCGDSMAKQARGAKGKLCADGCSRVHAPRAAQRSRAAGKARPRHGPT